MKRRDFLKRTGQAVMLAALPVAMLTAIPVAPSPKPDMEAIENWIREVLRIRMGEQMDKAAFQQMYHGTGLMSGDHGHYEGVRFIEQTHVPSGVPKRTHSYLDLVGNKWAWT